MKGKTPCFALLLSPDGIYIIGSAVAMAKDNFIILLGIK